MFRFLLENLKFCSYANNGNNNDVIVITELGAPIVQPSKTEPNKKRKLDASIELSDDGTDDTRVTFNNPPCMTWMYFYHVQKDMVNVAVSVISGSQNVDFGLSEDGCQLIVKYTWPAPMYSPEILFSKKVETHPMTHPLVHSFASEVLKHGLTQKSSPGGSIVVPLPVKVQREVGTWTFEGMKINNCDVLLLQFKAFQMKVVIDDADTSVTFK